MTNSLNESTTVFDACVQEGLAKSNDLIEAWCEGLTALLYDRSKTQADPAQRRVLQTAAGALKENRSFIESGFVNQLALAVHDDKQQSRGRPLDGTARSPSVPSFDKLELMGDNQVQEVVEGARLLQVIKLASEAGLVGFSARLSTAQGFSSVKSDKNPFRPEVVSQALFALLLSVPVTRQTRACWLGNGSQLMGEKLHFFYASLDKMLAQRGIVAAPYGLIATAESSTVKPQISSAPDAPSRPMQSAFFSSKSVRDERVVEGGPDQSLQSKLLTLGHLRHLLVGDYDASFKAGALASTDDFEAPLHTDFAHTVPAALDLLKEIEEKGIAPISSVTGPRPTPVPLAQLRAQLKTSAKSLGQSLAIEVVGLMIKQLANDERLLLPVRQVIVNAEPAFLRLAVSDPRFFSDKSHPARRLLDVITSASLAYASEDAVGFGEFMRNVQQSAAFLTEEHASDAQHFETLLKDFEDAQARHGLQYLDAQRRAVKALLQAEQRNLLAVKIAAEIRARPEFFAANRIIASFLTGPWSQVLAKERVLGEFVGAGQPKTLFSRTLDDLLWSLDLTKVSDHQKRLLKIIPDMLKSLREGLVSIDYPLDQSRSFFDELMMIHKAGLRPLPLGGGTAGKPHRELAAMFAGADEASDSSRPWLAPAEAQHSGFIEDWDEQIASDATTALDHNDASAQAVLELGDWVDLLVDLQWLRAQLTWISPHNTLFMFTSEGGRKHSMTARVLKHLRHLELVKVVSQQGVVEGALDGVARTAMRNSVGSEASD